MHQAGRLEPRTWRILSLIRSLLWQDRAELSADTDTAGERLAFAHFVFCAHASAKQIFITSQAPLHDVM